MQLAIRALKEADPELTVIADTCMCEYTSHGHCGWVREDGEVDNDLSLELIAKTALSQAAAGADAVAPSDMMDGRIGAIRAQLDADGFSDTPIISYSAKYASAFYGPFREAADSTPAHGDRRGYQMDPANVLEAIRESKIDLDEGADMLMVKPALPYLDVIRRVKEATGAPLGRLPCLGRVLDAQGRRRERLARRAGGGPRGADLDPPRRGRRDHHLLRQGRRRMAELADG